MSRFIVIILILAALLFPLTAAAIGTVPRAGNSIAEQLDEQLMMRFAGDDSSMTQKQRQALARARITIMGTTPANINNLEQACPLARQMTEEVSRWLINEGYRYQELRKGSYIRFDRRTGEFILTREVKKLARDVGTSQAILAGTYVISPKQVRFAISLIHTTSNEVLAKATATVPITDDLRPLLDEPSKGGNVPTVYTRLQ